MCDDCRLIDGAVFSISDGKVNIYNDSIGFDLTDDGIVTIYSGNYELLEIDTDFGEYVVRNDKKKVKKVKWRLIIKLNR